MLEGAVLANLFFEASTRTRISFGAAFCRLGGAVLELLAAHGVQQRVKVLGLPGDAFPLAGEARAQRHQLGLDAEGLRRAALEVLGR